MAIHWMIVRKYMDENTGKTWTEGREISVCEQKGRRMVRSGLYEKISEFDDGGPEAEIKVRELAVDPPQRRHRTTAQKLAEAKG
ncbi:MAG: hypothetical protein KDA27_27710 [Candidatus Eisenbacteria bacterium]|uniref:Uncharacterized protein n=1 Tax=Eiseniibacteriota bacterium TaxID=2212470 RepID=A0A956NLX6_UNCEI|nr:hypothetical protein [Candidatus Eisenbacteria bacterium]